MSDRTAIEWTNATWNPVTGCTKVSPGCAHCYAERVSKRFGRDFSKVTLHPDRLEIPLHWRNPRRVFAVSMGDLFHEDVPDMFIAQVFAVMAAKPSHTFQVLTKRPERMRSLFGDDWLQAWTAEYGVRFAGEYGVPAWPLPNVHLGVSVENQKAADERIPILLETPAAVWFISAEPLLVGLDLTPWLICRHCGYSKADAALWGDHDLCKEPSPRLDWVIVGGESGPRGRWLVERCPAVIHWLCDAAAAEPSVEPRRPSCGGTGWRPKPEALKRVRKIRDDCQAAGVPFLFKQWGGPTPKAGKRLLDGREWNEYPAREAVPA